MASGWKHHEGMPSSDMVPMVALVFGAHTAVGARVAVTLAMNGARLSLLGAVNEKHTLEQVARRATCIGSPSVDIHEVDLASAGQPGGGGDEGEAPPIETVHMVVETVLSRQGRVDIIVSCPPEPEQGMTVQQCNQQQLENARTVTRLLATSFLAPPQPAHRAVITITHHNNRQMHDWAKDLPSYMAKAAAEDFTGSSGPTAVGMSEEERLQAAQHVLLANIVLPEHEMLGTPAVCRSVAGAVIDLLHSWQQPANQEEPSEHPKEIRLSLTSPETTTPPCGKTQAEPPATAEHEKRHHAAGLKAAAKGVVHAVKGAADRALSPMGKSDESELKYEEADEPSGLPGSDVATEAAAASILDRFVAMSLHGSTTSGTSKPGASKEEHKVAAAAAMLSVEEEETVLAQLEGLLGESRVAQWDAEAARVTGRDPSPRPGATFRAPQPSSAVWIKSGTPPVGGILLATGSRAPPGLLLRPRSGPEELLKAAATLPGTVITPADPHNLEPEASRAYKGDPIRYPSYLVHCFKPFNGETPHQLLADEFLTPPELFYVRNHLPVPTDLKTEAYSFELSGPGIPGSPLSISLEELKQGRWGPVVQRQATLQCAGNRRGELCAVKLVEGRAPWNHGSIGNALWTGVDLCHVLRKAGFNPQQDKAAAAVPQHVIFEGWDYHHQSGTHFEVSIALGKVMDERGGVMLAWEMNGQELLPDHGYPLRMVVPGYVGTRSAKWLKRISLSHQASGSAWQQQDYKILPQKYTTLTQAEWKTMPPIMSMPVQSAILLPEPGSVVDGSRVDAVWFRGYAWCGGGLPITRVDVSADEGATWETADIVERESEFSVPAVPQDGDKVYSWVKWQVALQVPPSLRKTGGKWRVCCKAFNINCDTQPATLASVWNFRGLSCNSWHFADMAVTPSG